MDAQLKHLAELLIIKMADADMQDIMDLKDMILKDRCSTCWEKTDGKTCWSCYESYYDPSE